MQNQRNVCGEFSVMQESCLPLWSAAYSPQKRHLSTENGRMLTKMNSRTIIMLIKKVIDETMTFHKTITEKVIYIFSRACSYISPRR